ncbi:hypothetical protein [Streptomyces sp. CAU 1734]|uniref:hypothetical protein n=1 Tax=Streptomyces sp. CAU 1734 TaxID=3140360 RepID=UPI00325FE798
MAGPAEDFCSDLIDLSGVSLRELRSSRDPELRRALRRVDEKACAAFGALDASNSEEMRQLRRSRTRRHDR